MLVHVPVIAMYNIFVYGTWYYTNVAIAKYNDASFGANLMSVTGIPTFIPLLDRYTPYEVQVFYVTARTR